MSRSAAGTASSATRASVDRAGVRASSSGVPVASARGQRGHDDGRAVRIELAEDLREEARGLTRPVRPVELIPDRRKRVAEIAQEIRQHLAHRLRLARELRQVMPVVDRPLPEPLPRMQNPRPVASDDGHGRRADAHDQIEPGPATRHRVDGALEPHQRARRHRRERRRLRRERRRARVDSWRCSSTKRTPMVWPVASRWVSSRASICASSVALMPASVGADRNRHERLLPNGLATRLDAALIVAFAGPTETGFE